MIITLKNNKFTAQVDTLGAQLISFKDVDDIEYIWQRKAPHWGKCAPILFPIVGRAVNETITIDGKDYPMTIHGFASDTEFEIVNQKEFAVELSICSNEITRKCYPFEFKLTVIISLDECGLKTEMKVLNTDNKNIIFGIGGHPGINWPMFDGDEFSDYVFEFDKEYELISLGGADDLYLSPENSYRLDLDGNTFPLSADMFKYNTVVIDDVPFNKLNFINKNRKGIRFEFENFNTFAFWSDRDHGNAPFLCLEPWTSMGKRIGDDTILENKKDIISLPSGKEHSCWYKISPVE